MKSYIKTKILFCFTVLTVITSCELANDLDDYEPLYSLPAEDAIYDESSAELALAGVYSTLQGNGNYQLSRLTNSLSGMSQNPVTAIFAGGLPPEEQSFAVNDPISDGSMLLTIYTGQYTLINRANWLIEQASELSDDVFPTPNRREEIIGEAKILRAFGHFQLLRLFGQFYNLDSEYGINVRLSPAKSGEVQPRNTVSETYDAIINDLEDGISSAPELIAKYYVNKTFAKGLLAKVYMYMGNYNEAAILAQEVINNSGSNFQLLPSFEALFDHQSVDVFNNNSSLFNLYSDQDDEPIYYGNEWTIYSNFSSAVATMATTETVNISGQIINYDATRVPFMLTGAPLLPFPGLNGNMKYRQQTGGHETFYFLRMAEIYLIYAECEARNTNSVTTDALEALNAIRIRAGATSTGGNGFETYPQTISLEQFLEVVRKEKRIELATEQGEDWFDLIRYDYIDGFGSGFQVSNVKPTATNSDKFIMPIPFASIEVGNEIIKQNPSYK
ncbi:RagB/SusD family nutrient uptake outer membrane protein [Flavisericum labens]|uniref:RagB/SusD family nutrient uptake outer membrane protein n=1 Tax=Flavisericum labens TaxID=3377112 RepID=UPI00387B0B1D